MAMDGISGGHQPRSASLFRPAPASTLQNNLAEYYQKTADFVDGRYEAMNAEPEAAPRRGRDSEDEEKPAKRLNPRGLGQLVDMLV